MHPLLGPGAGAWVDKAPPLAERLKMMTVSRFERVRGYITLPEKLKMTTVSRFEGLEVRNDDSFKDLTVFLGLGR